jgi:hypothetical protein
LGLIAAGVLALSPALAGVADAPKPLIAAQTVEAFGDRDNPSYLCPRFPSDLNPCIRPWRPDGR